MKISEEMENGKSKLELLVNDLKVWDESIDASKLQELIDTIIGSAQSEYFVSLIQQAESDEGESGKDDDFSDDFEEDVDESKTQQSVFKMMTEHLEK